MAFVGFSSFRSPFFNYFFPEPRVMSLMFLVQVYPPRRARCHVHADSSPSMVSSSNARDNEATELTHTDGRGRSRLPGPGPGAHVQVQRAADRRRRSGEGAVATPSCHGNIFFPVPSSSPPSCRWGEPGVPSPSGTTCLQPRRPAGDLPLRSRVDLHDSRVKCSADHPRLAPGAPPSIIGSQPLQSTEHILICLRRVCTYLV
jgi:hypothetical protein